MNASAWLTARPVAHRGLHDRAAGLIENSLGAAQAAVSAGYAIECDVQMSGDEEAMVFHDFTLDRLTAETGELLKKSADELSGITLTGAQPGPQATIQPLPAFLDAIGGRTPVIIEIKSRFDGDIRLTERVAKIIATRRQPIALKSFDPVPIAYLRKNGVDLGLESVPLGIVAQADYANGEWAELPENIRAVLTHFLHFSDTRPDFLSWNVDDLPHATPNLLHTGLGLPVMCWTVRTNEQRACAAAWANQIIFEGFRP